jgi:hypothetical protein
VAKLQHRQVNIDTQLATVREIAGQLRTSGAAPALAEVIATLLGSNDGPTPLVELFNWAHEKSTTNHSVEQLRDDLMELLRICGQIGRHCTQAIFHPDLALEPFDRDALAKRLDFIAARLSQDSVRLRSLNAGRPVVLKPVNSETLRPSSVLQHLPRSLTQQDLPP